MTDRIDDKEEGVTAGVPVYSGSQGRLSWTVDSRNPFRLHFSTANDKLDYEVRAGGKTAQRDPILAGRGDDKVFLATAAVVWEPDLSGYIYSADYKSREPIEQFSLVPSFGIKYTPWSAQTTAR